MPILSSISEVLKPISSMIGDSEMRSLLYLAYFSLLASDISENLSARCSRLNIFSKPSIIVPVVSDTLSEILVNISFIKKGAPLL